MTDVVKENQDRTFDKSFGDRVVELNEPVGTFGGTLSARYEQEHPKFAERLELNEKLVGAMQLEIMNMSKTLLI